jgi:hypothetical protein
LNGWSGAELAAPDVRKTVEVTVVGQHHGDTVLTARHGTARHGTTMTVSVTNPART